jgi:hypothetical protein
VRRPPSCIRDGLARRRPRVDQRHADSDWLIEPLVEAGLGTEQIRTLVYRLGFEAVVHQGAPPVDRIRAVVADQPALVRAAWTEVVARMIVSTTDPVRTVDPGRRVPGDG